ncbi:MAG: hypothetical protein ACO225_00370 [Ilumatobacteraceae bacterium]
MTDRDGSPDLDAERDVLPDDLDAEAFAGAYEFPDNSRRRIPGAMYLLVGIVCLVLGSIAGETSPIVNEGFVWIGVGLTVFGAFGIASGWRMTVDERQALVAAQQAVGYPVGHASAQQVWHGVRSRPTWRVLCYSAEEPPQRRGLVLVDAVDGRIVEFVAEDNPERWQSASTGAEG